MRDIAEASLWLLNSHVLLLLNGVISDQYTLPAPLFCLQLLQINLEERKKGKKCSSRDPFFGPKRGQVEADDKESSINSTLASLQKLDLR